MIIYISATGILHYLPSITLSPVNTTDSSGTFCKKYGSILPRFGHWNYNTFWYLFARAAAIASSIIKVNNSKTLLPYIAIIVFLIALIPDNFTKYTLSIRKFGITALWIYLITLPLLLWVIAKLKGAYKS